MTCHSGGTLEIYVEPFLPRPALVLLGHGPVLDTLAALGRATQFDVSVVDAAATSPSAALTLTANTFVVVATHGSADEEALAQALASDAVYVSLVASRRRAAAVLERLKQRGLAPERLSALKAPAGLDIGALTPEEIAISIMAEIVQLRRSAKVVAAEPAPPSEAVDPICGMRVEIASARHSSATPTGIVYFCCSSCQEQYDRGVSR
jgi:xanthine dehydrogenase accessory factor